jgi:hypothetical protein
MADLVTTYTYTTAGGTIVFNDGALGDGTDKYWIQDIDGLDGPIVRAPTDSRPFTDGDILHRFRKSGRRPVLSGVIIIESVPLNSSACQEALNVMEEDLREAVESNISTSATLAWTPAGYGARSLTVYHNGQPQLEIKPIENYHLRSFAFGLISSAADW